MVARPWCLTIANTETVVCELQCRWDGVNLLLSADVLVLLRVAGHLANADSVLDVFELQTQVLSRDGEHGSSLPGACLWRQLLGRTN